MTFDVNKFDLVQVEYPTKTIPVPELKAFFDEGKKPEWVIKSLTGTELAIVNEAVSVVKKTNQIINALTSGNKGIEDGIKALMNKDSEHTPEDLVRRHKMLELGTVPPCPEHICVKLAEAKPTLFYRLTNEIIGLTGDGADLGK